MGLEAIDDDAMSGPGSSRGAVQALLDARLRPLGHTPSLATRQRNIVDVLLRDALEGDDRQVLSTPRGSSCGARAGLRVDPGSSPLHLRGRVALQRAGLDGEKARHSLIPSSPLRV